MYFQFHQEQARQGILNEAGSLSFMAELAEEKTFYSTCHISKLNAINNTSPKAPSQSKTIPYSLLR